MNFFGLPRWQLRTRVVWQTKPPVLAAVSGAGLAVSPGPQRLFILEKGKTVVRR
jgi:hypothetical protein